MRYVSIDLLRTVAIFLMVIVHFLENLAGADWAPAGLGAPLFGFLMGVSYFLWLNVAEGQGRSDDGIARSTVRRGVFLFVAGFAFNIFVWLPEDTFNWDVLTLLGTAFIILNVVRSQPPVVPVVFCVLIFVMSPVFRVQVGYDEYWIERYFDPDWTLADVLIGFFVTGYFPVFPWILFPIAGFLSAKQLQLERSSIIPGLSWSRVRGIVLSGLTLIMLAYGFRLIESRTADPMVRQLLGGWTMFPPSIEYVTGIFGCVLVSFGLCLWLIDGRRILDRWPTLLSFVSTMSRYSLSIYVLHHVVHLWPLWIYGVWMGQETTHYWQKAMSWPTAVVLVVVYFVTSYCLFRWIERGQRSSLESWMRWFSDPESEPPRHRGTEKK